MTHTCVSKLCHRWKFCINNFQAYFSGWLRRCRLWNCPQMNITEPFWWSVSIGSGNGLVPSGNKPLPEPMLTQFTCSVPNHYLKQCWFIVNWIHMKKAYDSVECKLCKNSSHVDPLTHWGVETYRWLSEKLLNGKPLPKRTLIYCELNQRHLLLTHWSRDKMGAISQTTSSSAFSWMKILEFRLKFHWSLFLRVHLTISQHWFR